MRFMSCSWCPKVEFRWFVQQHCLGGEGTEKSSWPLYSHGVGWGVKILIRFDFFPFVQILRRSEKGKWKTSRFIGRVRPSCEEGSKAVVEFRWSKTQNFEKKNIRSLFLGLFDQGNSRQKPFSGTIFHLLFWIIKAWNHCWFRNWILCIFCAASLF